MNDIANATRMDCWEWGGRVTSGGYGVVTSVFVHRTLFELFNGPIPDGLQVDHLCKNRRCANPAHLEAVTRAENVRRAGGQERADQCKRGHSEFHCRPSGRRRCAACDRLREKSRVRSSRRKAAAR